MNTCSDIFWKCFSSLGGMQWFISHLSIAGLYISNLIDYIWGMIGGLGK
jgi:hypothetical protein